MNAQALQLSARTASIVKIIAITVLFLLTVSVWLFWINEIVFTSLYIDNASATYFAFWIGIVSSILTMFVGYMKYPPKWIRNFLGFLDQKIPNGFASNTLVVPIALLLISFVTLQITKSEHQFLGTDSGHVRVFESGKMTLAGEVLKNELYSETSVTVPLSFNGMGPSIRVGSSFYKKVNLKVQITLMPNKSLRNLLSKDLPLVGFKAEDSNSPLQNRFFRERVEKLLLPSAEIFLTRISENKIQGGESVVLVHFGKILDEQKHLFPGWLGKVTATKVAVVQVEVSN